MSRFKCPATISPNSFIQIMINATIIVNLVIYKLLMSKKMRKNMFDETLKSTILIIFLLLM